VCELLSKGRTFLIEIRSPLHSFSRNLSFELQRCLRRFIGFSQWFELRLLHRNHEHQENLNSESPHSVASEHDAVDADPILFPFGMVPHASSPAHVSKVPTPRKIAETLLTALDRARCSVDRS
jgi:hypothetical protein